MGEKQDAVKIWIANVMLIIVPIVVSTCTYCFISIGSDSFSNIVNNIVNNVVNNIVVILFSIACSQAITSYQVKKQKKDSYVNNYFYFSLGVAFCAWTAFILLQTGANSYYGIIVIIIASILIIILIKSGVVISKKGDENENEMIRSMHTNCEKIRDSLIPQNENKMLKSHAMRENELLCNPEKFVGVEHVLKNIQEKRDSHE